MRKNKYFVFFIILLVLATVCTLFSCKKKPVESGDVNGEVIGVSAGMNTVYAALLAADGSKDQTVYYLSTSGSYKEGEKEYEVSLSAEIDVTQANIENDARSRLALEVKSGTTEILALYYSEGTLYINCTPYISRGKISDFALAEKLAEIHREKNNGAVKSVIDLIPQIASDIFDGCKYYYTEETKASRYVFSLSYARLFESLGDLVARADIGITSAELLAALHVTEALSASLSSQTEKAEVEFALTDGAFSSVKATGNGKEFRIDTFTLSRDSVSVGISSAVSEFKEFDVRNLYVKSGKARLSFDREDWDLDLDNYGIAANLYFVELTYPFDYTLATHYVAGTGLEGSLVIRDKNAKTTSFVLKDGYLYVDLSAYGIAKCKIARTELERRLSVLGMTDTDAYTFKDKVRLAALLAAGITKEGDRVECSFGKDVFALLSEKIGVNGLFGIQGGTLSWSVQDNVLSDVSASISLPGMTLTLSNEYEAFAFGTPNEIILPADAEAYSDLAENGSTHVSLSGTVKNDAFSNSGKFLSSLLSSMTGETLTFAATGNVLEYTADILYGATGTLDRALISVTASRKDVVKLYYTSEDRTHFTLILPPDEKTQVRPIRLMAIAEAPFAAFNADIGLERTAKRGKMYLASAEDHFTLGANASLASDAIETLGKIHSGLTCRWIDEMAFDRIEFAVYADKLEGKVVFDGRSSVTVTADTFSVKHNDPFDVDAENIGLEKTSTDVSLFDNNAMPSYATVPFTGIESPSLKVSLDGLWTYVKDQVPKVARTETQTVEASATVFSKVISRTLTVDCSVPVNATLAPVSEEASVYDPNNQTFTFERYGDKKVTEVLAKFDLVSWSGFAKEITSWILPNSIEAESVVIQPLVTTYFGTTISLGVDFNLRFVGAKLASCEEEIVFEAYDGRDPFDPAAYPATITAQTESGDPVTVTVGKWDPSVALDIKDYEGHLYACSLTDTVKAQVYDCLYDRHRTPDTVSVSIRLLPKRLPEEDADLDFDMSNCVGSSYDKESKTFFFDVLYIHSLTSTVWDRILPSKLLVDGQVYFSGINWSFASVAKVENAVGLEGELTLRVGDSVSGFQTRAFPYKFIPINVTGIALLDEAGDIIVAKTNEDEDLYDFTFEDVNLFTYRYPTYIKVTYNEITEQSTGGEDPGEDPEDPGEVQVRVTRLAADWTFDKPFSESAVVNGGTYVGTSLVGSRSITVTFTFDSVRVFGYDFGGADAIDIPAYTAKDGTEVSGGALSYKDNNGEKRLLFSVNDTLSNILRYFDEESYPSSIRIYLNADKTESAVVPVDGWDLSSYKNKTNIVTSGFPGSVVAIVRGMRITVYTNVSPAIGMSDSVYTDETIAETKTVKFSLLTADGGSAGYKVNDPRKVENYPTKLYIQKSGSLTRDKQINIVRWEGYEAFNALFAEEIAKGTPVQNISGRYLCTAIIGDDNVGYGEVKIEVVLGATVLEDLDVAGIPAAVSSEFAATETGDAIKRIAGGGTRVGSKETFEYAFSLEMNPYYVSPDSLKSYPRYITFTLNGLPVRTTATWDLSKVDPMATKFGNTYKYNETDDPCGYPVYAELDLGADLPNIKIGVEVNIKSREIAYIWIDGSSQPYIYIDGYADAPFGTNVVGKDAYLKVYVQFVGDLHTYPLYLRYDTSDISLSYDGRGYKDETTHSNFRVFVGNDSGGYQPISGYSVRVVAKRVNAIGIVNGSVTPFYEKEEANDGTGTFVEHFYHVEDLVTIVDGVPTMPTELEVTFAGNPTPVRIHEYKGAAKEEGLVFEWIRDEKDRLGVRLWNSNVDVSIRGADQELYNKEHAGDQTAVTQNAIFAVDSYVLPYGDTVETYLTPNKVLAAFASNFKVGLIEEKYQTRYIVKQGEEVALDANVTLHAGEYLICVTVEGHGLYKGTTSIPFTVTPKNIEAEVILYKDSQPVDQRMIKDGIDYNKLSGYVFTATSGTYIVAVPMTVNGESAVILQDVRYSDVAPYDIIAYELVVRSSSADYAVGENNVGKAYAIKVNEVGPEAGLITLGNVTWNAGKSDFDFEVFNSVENAPLSRFASEENLTHGFVVRYYNDEDHEILHDGALVEGETYYCIIKYKIENYFKGGWDDVTVVVPVSE